MFLYAFEDSLCFKSSLVLAIWSFPELRCGTNLLLFFIHQMINVSALLEMELVPTLEMRGLWEVSARGRLGWYPGMFPVFVVVAAAGFWAASPGPGGGCSHRPQSSGSAGSATPAAQPAGLCAGCSKSPQLHGAGSSSRLRLEAAPSPSASDSYSERASGRASAYSRRENRLAALSSRAEEESSRDYKKVGVLN